MERVGVGSGRCGEEVGGGGTAAGLGSGRCGEEVGGGGEVAAGVGSGMCGEEVGGVGEVAAGGRMLMTRAGKLCMLGYGTSGRYRGGGASGRMLEADHRQPFLGSPPASLRNRTDSFLSRPQGPPLCP
eukprot:220294-Chlamydomonas_euryale.AAC.5